MVDTYCVNTTTHSLDTTRDPLDTLSDARALHALCTARDAGTPAPFDVDAPWVSYWVRRTNDGLLTLTTVEQVARSEYLVQAARRKAN